VVHDSRDSQYREPGGAQPEGGKVTLRIKTAANDLGSAKIRIWNSAAAKEQFVSMSLEKSEGGTDTWAATLDLPTQPTIFWYRFALQDGSATTYYEDNLDRDGGLGTTWDQPPDYDYSIAVYDPKWTIPDWAKDAVVYQIFPDRFNNGDPSNDKPAGTFSYGGQTTQRKWGEPPAQPPQGSDFFGGDLEGVIRKLDYLQKLGVTLIYFNPIFASPSNHRYDTSDYSKIDPALGDKATFDRLVTEAQKRGIHIMLDGVFNHSSSDSVYFDKYHRYDDNGATEAKDSPYYPWYIFSNWPQFYESWQGYDTLPKYTEIGAIRDFIFRNKDSVAQSWLAEGAAGWRLDAAEQKSEDFWRDFRSRVRGAYPDALLVGEFWHNANQWLLGNEWDGVMNYRFRDVALAFANGLPPATADSQLAAIREDYPPNGTYASMNIIDSHDTIRALTSANGDKNKLMQMALLQFTSPGMPTVYYGDEAGLEGGPDPDDRRTYPWGSEDTHLIDYYSLLANVRHKLTALRTGSYDTLAADNSRKLYVFLRKDDAGQAVAAFNTGDQDQKDIELDVSGKLPDGTSFTDVLNASTVYKVEGGKLRITVPAHWGGLLVPDDVAKQVVK
jgi:glycosidase